MDIQFRVRVGAVAAVLITCAAVVGCATTDSDVASPTRVALIDGGVEELEALECYDIEQVVGVRGSDHGTAMASVVLGAVEAPCENADSLKLGSFPVLDEEAKGATAASVTAALSEAISWQADIVNISVDLRTGSDELESMVEQAQDRGIVVVAAAGNRMGMPAGFPAAYEPVISVGAADTDGSPAWMSAVDGVDIYATGIDIYALDARGVEFVGEGTSFAAAAHTRALAEVLR